MKGEKNLRSPLLPIFPWYGERYEINTDSVVTGWHVWGVRVCLMRKFNHELRISFFYGSKSLWIGRRKACL